MNQKVKTRKMMDGEVALFNTFMFSSDFLAAVKLISGYTNVIPPASLMNDIIFKIIMNSDEKIANEAVLYLHTVLTILPNDSNEPYDFTLALQDKTSNFPDIWSVFSHFTVSYLHHHKISQETDYKNQTFVKSPNCDNLIGFYVRAFEMCCSANSIVLQVHREERLFTLLRWINQFYKYNIQKTTVLQHLHKLLDLFVKCKVSLNEEESLSMCLVLTKRPLLDISHNILNTCKDAFANSENQQRFFNNMALPYLITKICHCRLEKMIFKSVLENSSSLTLKSIMENYLLDIKEKKSIKKTKCSPRSLKKSNRKKKILQFSKESVPGDTKLHEYCRLSKPADLLGTLIASGRANLNSKNSAGNTPLHLACLASSFYCAEFLFQDSQDSKPDIKATDLEGRTPLHYTAHVNALDIAKLLLSHGGNDLVNCRDNFGEKPIDYARSTEMREILLNAAYELESRNELLSSSSSENGSCFKSAESISIYMCALRMLLINYFEIIDFTTIKQTDTSVLSHENKECCHYKASSANMWCSDDFSVADQIFVAVSKLFENLKIVGEDIDIEDELFLFEAFLLMF